MINILLIEDEYGVSNFIKRGLEESHYHVTLAYEGRMGLNLALEIYYKDGLTAQKTT